MGEENLLYKNKYRVPSARLAGWNYSDYGFYFVTICTKNRKIFFGDIINGEMHLSKIGNIVKKCWIDISKHFLLVHLDEFIIMPNHVHGILVINNNVETQDFAQNVETQDFASLRCEYKNKFGPQSKNLSSIIRGFKIGVKKYTIANKIDFAWQERFYDRVIRNSEELNRIRQYIIDNPLEWHLDRNNPNKN